MMHVFKITRCGKSVRLATILVALAGLGLAGCDDNGGDPRKEIGANPMLPALQQYLLPPIHIAKPVAWGDDTPKVAQGLQLLEAFYWDKDDDTRAFAKRFAARPGMNGKMPSGNQAGVYASTLAYLNAVAATGSDNAKDVVPEMKKFSGKDKLFGDITIRQDGRVIHPMYLFEVKKPQESKYPYDYYKLVSTIPAEQAFRPMADGGCSLVK